jgi:hypothetical protein
LIRAVPDAAAGRDEPGTCLVTTPALRFDGRSRPSQDGAGPSCRTMGSGGMAVFQAVGAFRLFTGLEPDPERMLRHFAAM